MIRYLRVLLHNHLIAYIAIRTLNNMNPSRFMSIFLLVIICNPAFSQPNFQGNISTADSLMNEGNVPGAIEEYRRFYNSDPTNPVIVYNYACALSIDNTVIRQFDSCFKYLNIAIELDTSIAALTDPDLIPARDDKNWIQFENRLISMINIKYGNPYKDIDYARALWRLAAYDQAYFDEIGIAFRKIGMRSSVASAIWKLKFMIQEKNQEELEQLVTANGWPEIAEVGTEAAMAAYLVAMHTNDGSQKKYLPKDSLYYQPNTLLLQHGLTPHTQE